VVKYCQINIRDIAFSYPCTVGITFNCLCCRLPGGRNFYLVVGGLPTWPAGLGWLVALGGLRRSPSMIKLKSGWWGGPNPFSTNHEPMRPTKTSNQLRVVSAAYVHLIISSKLYVTVNCCFLLSGYGALVAEVKMRSFGEQLVCLEWPGRIRWNVCAVCSTRSTFSSG